MYVCVHIYTHMYAHIQFVSIAQTLSLGLKPCIYLPCGYFLYLHTFVMRSELFGCDLI